MTSSEHPYRVETTDSYSIITLLPELNDSQWADFEKVGSELTDRVASSKSPKFVVDLSPLNYMGSAMVAMIVRLWKTSNEKNGQMAVVNNDEMVFEVLKLAGLHKVWTIVNTREEAVKALGKRMKPGRVATVNSPGSGSADDDSMTLPIVAAVGVIIALIGIGLILAKSTAVSPQIAFFLGMAGAIVGLIAGSMGAAKSAGGAKSASIVAVALSALLLLVGILKMPQSAAGEVTQPETSLGTESDTPPVDGADVGTPAAKGNTTAPKKNAGDKKNSRRGDDEVQPNANAPETAPAENKPAAPAEEATPNEEPAPTAEPAADNPESVETPAAEASEAQPKSVETPADVEK